MNTVLKKFLLTFLVGMVMASSKAWADPYAVSGAITPTFRGNSNTTYFGWDIIDLTTTSGHAFNPTPPPGLENTGFILDDNTPDLGTNPGAARLFQNITADAYGHRSGSNNYYSGFGGNASTANDTITSPTAGPGSGGFTTIILQIVGNGPSSDLAFPDVGGATPTVVKGTNLSSNAQWWVHYDITGNLSSYNLLFSSIATSIALDKLLVDTAWSSEGFVAAQNVTAIVPEPASIGTAGLAIAGLLSRRMRRRIKA